MSLWHAQCRSRTQDSGKFRRRAAMGTSRSSAGQHRGWHYDILGHQTGASVRRTTYSVVVSDALRGHVAYLRDFASSAQAAAAAIELIEDQQYRRPLPRHPEGIGTIPQLPTGQEK